jgi:hypothetical protein
MELGEVKVSDKIKRLELGTVKKPGSSRSHQLHLKKILIKKANLVIVGLYQ